MILIAFGCATIAYLSAKTQLADPCLDPNGFAMLDNIELIGEVKSKKAKTKDHVFLKISGSLAADEDHLAFSVIRGERPSKLSLSWMRFSTLPFDPEREWSETIEIDGENIRVVWSEDQLPQDLYRTGRVLILGNSPVDSLVRRQFESMTKRLRRDTEPLTMILAEVITKDQHIEKLSADARSFLVRMVRHHRQFCGRS